MDLIISVVPPLAAWSAVLPPPQVGMLILAVAFVVMLMLDLAAAGAAALQPDIRD